MDTEYRDLVEGQQDLIVRFNLEGRLLFVNEAYCSTLGMPKESLINSIFMPVTEERYSDAIATRMTSLFRPPYACIVEQWLQTQKGMRCISWSARSVLGADGTVESIVATGRDVTPMKNEMKTLRKRDAELMLVLESGERMYYTHAPDHLVAFVSPRIRDLLGCRPGEGKRTWTDYLTDHPGNSSGLERTIRALASGRREPPYRLEMATRDGRKIWVEVNEVPVLRNGKAVAIAGFLTDITDRMAVEEGTAEAELFFRGEAKARKPAPARPAAPRGLIRSIFARGEDEEQDEGVV